MATESSPTQPSFYTKGGTPTSPPPTGPSTPGTKPTPPSIVPSTQSPEEPPPEMDPEDVQLPTTAAELQTHDQSSVGFSGCKGYLDAMSIYEGEMATLKTQLDTTKTALEAYRTANNPSKIHDRLTQEPTASQLNSLAQAGSQAVKDARDARDSGDSSKARRSQELADAAAAQYRALANQAWSDDTTNQYDQTISNLRSQFEAKQKQWDNQYELYKKCIKKA